MIQKLIEFEKLNIMTEKISAKNSTFGDYKIYLDKFWRPSIYKMINHQTGKSTDLLVENIKFKVGLSEATLIKNLSPEVI